MPGTRLVAVGVAVARVSMVRAVAVGMVAVGSTAGEVGEGKSVGTGISVGDGITPLLVWIMAEEDIHIAEEDM